MKKLKRLFRSNGAGLAMLVLCLVCRVESAASSGGAYSLTKDVWGASGGIPMTGGPFSLTLSAGESWSGSSPTDGMAVVHSGYLSGYSGTAGPLKLLHFQVGTTAYYEEGIQVGVPLDAPVQLTFSGPLMPSSVAAGIQTTVLLDHLGRMGNQPEATTRISLDPPKSSLTLALAEGWQGNTFYDVSITPQLQDIDGFTFSEAIHIQFLTALDPQQENVVLRPIPSGLIAAAGVSPVLLSLNLPSQALSEFSLIRVNSDPLGAPLRVDPRIIQEANQKALSSSGGYAVPIALREINGFNLRGQPLNTLSRPASLSISMPNAALRAGALSLWALDEGHRLWVKLPSQKGSDAQTTSAAVGRFSVFALMSGAAGTAVSTYVFPNPWRPHGPHAGNGLGQSGTVEAGMIFNNLPSECMIQIYTLSGNKVRELRHSDLAGSLGQESWNGKTIHGDPAASGVYLWRVESSDDAKTGKLMIIR